MKNHQNSLLDDVANYYKEKLEMYGDTPRGVDWNSSESQSIRFCQLNKLINPETSNFSLNDLGCGYGAFFEYLLAKYPLFSYSGIDISPQMISAAQKRNGENQKARFISASEPDTISDYGVASGIFNVRLDREDTEWYQYLQTTLDIMHSSSRLGFSFNCLTSYSDEEKKRDHLFYADPCRVFDLCKRRYSRQVALYHDYGLYEFTIVVRKST